MLGLKILHTVHKAMKCYCREVTSSVELYYLPCQFGTAGDLLWLQGQDATTCFFNRIGKAGTEKVPRHRYKECREGGILLIWILELTENICGHDLEWRV